MPIRSPGPCLAIRYGEGSERSHHGFRDYSHRKQHPLSRFHLFRRDSNMARLSGTAAMTHLRFQISDLRDDDEAFRDRLFPDALFEIRDLKCEIESRRLAPISV